MRARHADVTLDPSLLHNAGGHTRHRAVHSTQHRPTACSTVYVGGFPPKRLDFVQIDEPSEDWPLPGLAGHTLTLVDDTKLWLVGGFSSPEYFNEMVYEYDAGDNSWTELEITGSTPTGQQHFS